MKIITRSGLVRLGAFAVVCCVVWVCVWFTMVRMPGESFRGPLPALSADEAALKDELARDVEVLAGWIGERNVFLPARLAAAAEFIKREFTEAGYEVRTQEYEVNKILCSNIEVEIAGTARPDEIVVIGAHYDSVAGSAGANDNASGVAALLALAHRFSGKKTLRTLRFVAFVNEEPPFFQTGRMGSVIYAERCRKGGENIVAMASLETIGYYTDEPGSQKYPPPFSLFYPSTGNFIGFVGNFSSRPLVRKVVSIFRRSANFPSEGAAIPDFITGVGWSDHWAFYRAGFPALMVTDTGPFRYPYYHDSGDTPERIDYERMARVVAGLEKVVGRLVEVVEH